MTGKVEKEKEIHLVMMQNFTCQWHIEDETVRCKERRDWSKDVVLSTTAYGNGWNHPKWSDFQENMDIERRPRMDFEANQRAGGKRIVNKSK